MSVYINVSNMLVIPENWVSPLLTKSIVRLGCREEFLQDQLRAAKDSVQNMQRLHEYGQSQLFDLRTQSGVVLIPFLSRSKFLISLFRQVFCFVCSLTLDLPECGGWWGVLGTVGKPSREGWGHGRFHTFGPMGRTILKFWSIFVTKNSRK